MATSREDAIRQLGKTSHQQALVQKLLVKTVKPLRFTIPAGANLTQELDEQGLRNGCYNWLRGCQEFTQVTVSLARDASKIQTRERKVEDFESVSGTPIWHTKAHGRKWLSEKIAKALFEHDLVAIMAKPDGLYLVEDTTGKFGAGSDNWEPFVEFIPKRREEYRETQ